jgi:hypothetical protein
MMRERERKESERKGETTKRTFLVGEFCFRVEEG